MRLNTLYLHNPVLVGYVESKKFTAPDYTLTMHDTYISILNNDTGSSCITAIGNLHMATVAPEVKAAVVTPYSQTKQLEVKAPANPKNKK